MKNLRVTSNPGILFGLFLIMAPTLAMASTPQQTVQTIIDKAKLLDQPSLRSENARKIESLVDFNALAAQSLGENATRASAAQKKEIADLLRKIITKTVYPEAPNFFTDVQIEFTTAKEVGGKTQVTSVVTKGTKRSTVDYWLAQQGAEYKVVDLAIEGERWVENVHDQFSEVIRKEGVSGLISRMKKRSNQLDENKVTVKRAKKNTR